jgi:hypothetical protein
MNLLASYLADRNAATLAWVAEDPANRWAGTYTEDLAHWAELGVLTVRDFHRYEMVTSYSDLYKDVCGIRPRGMDLDSMSYEELEKEYNYLMTQLDRAIEANERYNAEWDQEYRLEQEAERAAWLAEQPEAIDYVACHYQEGWL